MKPVIVLIGGGSASGKTLFTQFIKKELNEDVSIINIDNFYADHKDLTFEQREKLNYDHPNAIDEKLMIECVKKLKDGEEVDIPLYDFANHRRSIHSMHIKPCKYIVVDGIFALYYQDLLKLSNYNIYVDAKEEIRLKRRIYRDINERGRSKESVLKQFHETVAPMHNIYIEPTKNNATYIFTNNLLDGINEKEINYLINQIKSL